MRLQFILIFLSFAGYTCSQSSLSGMTSTSRLPLNFIENSGQIHDQNNISRNDIVFAGQTGNVSYFIRKNGISYQFSKVLSWTEIKDPYLKQKRKMPDTTVIYRLDATWLNANSESSSQGEGVLPGYDNFYYPGCPAGALNVNTFESVLIKNIHDKIDVRYYSANGALKYDYIVRPFANYHQIKILISGATGIKYSSHGSILISTPFGQIEEAAPKVYQNKRVLPSKWIISDDTLSFEIASYDPSQPMVIDPIVREWSTYCGGSGDEWPGSLKTDQSGNTYLSGYTTSSISIATTGAHQTVFAGGINSTGDAFVVKFNNAGVRQWATYYGGNGSDNGRACAIDAGGNVYLTGTTNTGGWWSPGSASVIAGPGSFISTYTTGTNGFLVKFNNSGVKQWGTYTYGNPGACVTDLNGDVYIAGEFPANFSGGTTAIIATSGAHQTASGGGQDGFIIKFTSSGVRIWGTYYGGGGSEVLTSLAIDNNNNLYASGHGWTNTGTTIATPGSHQFNYGGFNSDGFLVKFNSSGLRLWATYYGATDYDYGWSCCTDPSGNVYLAGTQLNYYYPYSGTLIATPGSYQSVIGGGSSDAYLVKFNPSGIRQWATYYGGNGSEDGLSCFSDAYGNIYLSGITTSTASIASPGAFQTSFGGGNYDAFLAKFDNNGLRKWGTYYGDTGIEYGNICITDVSNNVYLCGIVNSTVNIASTGSHQSSFGGGPLDVFIAKFSECYTPAIPVNVTPIANSTLCTGNITSLTAQSNGNITWYTSLSGTLVAGLGASFTTPTLAAGVYTYYAGASLCGDSINPIRIAVTFTVSANTPPIITANTGSICSGQTFTIQPSGASSYTIYGGSFIVTPLFTTPYLISGTSSLGCVSSSYATVTVSPSPTITVNSGNRCDGTIYTITPSGAFTYTISGNSFTVAPNVNTSYSVTGTSSTGCAATNTAVVNVNVIPSPTITVTPSGSICAGEVFFINASSGPVQGWCCWSITGGDYNVTPSVTTSYTVTGWAMNGCSDTGVVTVSVFPVPSLSVTNGFTCLGDSYTISPTGATTYSITGNTFVVSPFQNTNYTVTAANQYGCASQPAVCTVSVWVRPTISTNSGTICAGQSFTITPFGGVNYSVSGGSTVVSPANSTTYSVIGTNTSAAIGCQVSYPVISTVIVNPAPYITANSGTICAGENFSVVPSGALTYTYSSGSAIVTPTSNSTYSITGTNSSGCISPTPGLSQVLVLPKPALQVVSSDTTICAGEAVILTASGAFTYTIHGYSFNPTISITPSITTQYTITGTGSNGCLASFQITQVVDLCTQITENSDESQSFKIYPNPSTGELFVEVTKEIKIVLHNTLGQILKSETLSTGINSINIHDFAPGVYFIRCDGQYKNNITKIIKQ
jgi:hypothetical protein